MTSKPTPPVKPATGASKASLPKGEDVKQKVRTIADLAREMPRFIGR